MKKILIAAVILAIIAFGFVFINKGNTGNVIAESIDDGNVIKILASDISQNAQWFAYDSNGVEIRYFAVKAKDGTIKTAFDACDVCYRSGKGYSQKGEDMVCNNCGNHYAISGLGTRNLRGGGCWPGYLPSSVEGDYLVINKSDLETGRYRFDF